MFRNIGVRKIDIRLPWYWIHGRDGLMVFVAGLCQYSGFPSEVPWEGAGVGIHNPRICVPIILSFVEANELDIKTMVEGFREEASYRPSGLSNLEPSQKQKNKWIIASSVRGWRPPVYRYWCVCLFRPYFPFRKNLFFSVFRKVRSSVAVYCLGQALLRISHNSNWF